METIFRTDEAFDSLARKRGAFGNAVNKANIPNLPVRRNSNSFAHQAVSVLGVPRPRSRVWAPGSDVFLKFNHYGVNAA